MSTCFSTCRSTSPGTGLEPPRQSRPRARSVSRSSPNILITICARTPAMIWYHTVGNRLADVEAGAAARRAARGHRAQIVLLRPRRSLQGNFEVADMDAIGVLVDSERPVRRPDGSLPARSAACAPRLLRCGSIRPARCRDRAA